MDKPSRVSEIYRDIGIPNFGYVKFKKTFQKSRFKGLFEPGVQGDIEFRPNSYKHPRVYGTRYLR